MTHDATDGVLDRLIEALAAQLDASDRPILTPAAGEALAELSRAEANLIYSTAGHLVHYGTETDQLELLIQLVSDIQRGEASAAATIVVGDKVRLVGEPPDSLASYDPNWLRESVFVVRYVGDDATVDVQPELWNDYVIETVPIAAVNRTGIGPDWTNSGAVQKALCAMTGVDGRGDAATESSRVQPVTWSGDQPEMR